jgi:hypothetical protein
MSSARTYSHNYVYHRGIEIAYQDFLEYNTQLTILIENLGLSCPMFDFVKDFMETKVSDAKSVLKEVTDT